MTKLNHNKYEGFALGIRIADRFVLQASISNPLDVVALHAIKNMVNVTSLQRELKTLSINNQMYIGNVSYETKGVNVQ